MNRARDVGILVVLLTAIATIGVTTQKGPDEKGGEYFTGPYELVPNWPLPISGKEWVWGRVPAAVALSPDRVLVVQTGELPALERPMGKQGEAGTEYIPNRSSVRAEGLRETNKTVFFDRNGKLIESWTQWDHLFNFQHRVAINPHEPEANVWVVDNQFAQVFKFSPDGKKLLMTVGMKNEQQFRGGGVRNLKGDEDPYHFDGPNDIAFFPNGDFIVADGSRNRRIAKFSKDGKFLMQWGKPSKQAQTDGSTPPAAGRDMSEFGNLHAVAVDAKNRVYVADWGNGRVAIFDSQGKFLDEWPNIPRPGSISVTKDQKYVWVTDDTYNKVMQFDMNGRLLDSWGTFGGRPGMMWGPHHLSVDTEGNLYIAEIYNGRVEKFRPRKGADPNRLVSLLFKDHVK